MPGTRVPVYLPPECLRHNLLAVASTGKGKSTLFQHLAQALCLACVMAWTRRFAPAWPSSSRMAMSSMRSAGCSLRASGTMWCWSTWPTATTRWASTRSIWWVETVTRRSIPSSRSPNTCGRPATARAPKTCWSTPSKPWPTPTSGSSKATHTRGRIGSTRCSTSCRCLRLPSFRHAVLEQVRDGLLLDWWQHYYEPMDAHQQREITSSVITKLSKFASSRVARRILGQPRSTLDLREVMRQGKLLLVSTASGVVGADLSELIGIVLLGLFEAALAEQAAVPFEQRRRYLVLIDEFQVYRNANYQGMLAELRKYGGSFALATQSLAYLDRLDRTLRATVLANIDHLFAFHMAGEDARLLHELDGILEDDITSLDDFQCYVKLSLGGHRLPVFSLALDAPPYA